MIYKMKFCLWLVDTLSRQPLTFHQICEKWLESPANVDGNEITERTFNRYRRDAEILLNVDIKCNKSQGNVYSVNTDIQEDQKLWTDWMLSTFSMAGLSSYVNMRKNIMLENPPSGTENLEIIMMAIKHKYKLSFWYKSFYHDNPYPVQLIPCFLRLFRQRWYLIGEQVDKKQPRIYALERISLLEEIKDEHFKLSVSKEKIYTPENFFQNCFGVIRPEDKAPITIRFRAFWPQNLYLKDVPIHTSQVAVAQTEEYTDYEITVRPTYDLKQELLWHRDKIAILSPESFRQDMISVLKAILAGYETGVSHAIDE